MEINDLAAESVLTQVSTRKIDSKKDGVKAVFCIRNEKFRLAFFLDYYRQLGVTEFFAIDNNSDDETQSYLLSQTDVHVFYTEASYKESNAGRDWTSELADQYCKGNWCLTLDVDEYLVYPFIEHVNLNQFTAYLDHWGYQGLFTVFLDFYSKKPLSQTNYKEGDSPFDVCNYFDTSDSYHVFETPNFPFLQLKGGIRQRKFWDVNDPRSGPSMRKLVLVKWVDGFEYLHSTHSCSAVRLADITGVLAHFKFMDHFKDYSKSEVARNDRVANSGDWRVYANVLEKEDMLFWDDEISIEYSGSQSLYKDGHTNCSLRYFDYVFSQRSAGEKTKPNFSKQTKQREELAANNAISSITYRELNKIWSGVGLFSQTFGSSSKGVQDIFRIEEDIDSLINSPYWRGTLPLRKFASKLGLCDQRSFPEEMRSQSTYTRFTYTFRSVWWDISSPIRLIVRVVNKIVGRKSGL